MPQSVRPLIEARREQMFPLLEPEQIDRLARFGERRSYVAGERMAAPARSRQARLSSRAAGSMSRSGDSEGHSELIVTHGPGSFMGELAQLSGRPSLVDAVATEAVEAFVVPPRRLRDLLVEEAELGERIMRALILRRVGLLETRRRRPDDRRPRRDTRDVLRLARFLTRNGHPHQRFDPADRSRCAQTLIERFHVDPRELPIVLCPDGQLLRNPSEVELARCIGLVRPIDPDKIYDVVIVGAGPAGLAASVYAGIRGPVGRWCWTAAPSAARPGASARIENYLGFPTGITGMALMARAYQPGAEIRRRNGDSRTRSSTLDCLRAKALSADSGRAASAFAPAPS